MSAPPGSPTPTSGPTARLIRQTVFGLLAASLSTAAVRAQDLVPGAYAPAPIGFNVVTVSANVSGGDIAFDPSLPVEDARATLGATFLGFARTLGIAGRYANFGVGMPLVFGHLEGRLSGQFAEATRKGQGDLVARVGINLLGAPAMTPQQFAQYRPKTIVGVLASVGVPLGQYNPERFINIGTNRWSVKTEVGVLHTRGRWTIEGDFGTSFFADNTNYAGGVTLQQKPIVSAQGHLIYTIRPGLWVAGDGNFWTGGLVTVDGTQNLEQQRNSRLGFTLAVPIARQQLRIAYSYGAYTTVGGDFRSVGVSYSYAWAGRP